MNRQGLEGYGPNAGKWDYIYLGYLVTMDELDRMICFCVVQWLYDSKQEEAIQPLESAPPLNMIHIVFLNEISMTVVSQVDRMVKKMFGTLAFI
eukprot:g18845.t1